MFRLTYFFKFQFTKLVLLMEQNSLHTIYVNLHLHNKWELPQFQKRKDTRGPAFLNRCTNCWQYYLFSRKHLEPDVHSLHKGYCLKFSLCVNTKIVTPVAHLLTPSKLPVIQIFRAIMVIANPYAAKNDNDKSVLKKMQLISQKMAPLRL